MAPQFVNVNGELKLYSGGVPTGHSLLVHRMPGYGSSRSVVCKQDLCSYLQASGWLRGRQGSAPGWAPAQALQAMQTSVLGVSRLPGDSDCLEATAPAGCSGAGAGTGTGVDTVAAGAGAGAAGAGIDTVAAGAGAGAAGAGVDTVAAGAGAGAAGAGAGVDTVAAGAGAGAAGAGAGIGRVAAGAGSGAAGACAGLFCWLMDGMPAELS